MGEEEEERIFSPFVLSSFHFSFLFSPRNASYSGYVHIIRDLKVTRRRRQRERQTNNGLNKQNNNSARVSRVFEHLFAVTARLRRENA